MMAKSASSGSKDINKMAFLVTQESRLQRLPGAATADGPNFEWQMAGVLALRAYEQRLQFEIFSNVKVARPLDDLVLRLSGPAHLVPSPYMYFIQLKHSRPGVKERTVKEQAFTSNSGDFSLPKYMEWYTKLRDQHNTEEFSNLLLNTPLENVRLALFTTKDSVSNRRQGRTGDPAASNKPFPFEDLFYTSSKGAEDVFGFDSSFPKVWQLFDQDRREDLYKNEFLPSLKVFCNQANSRYINGVIEELMCGVFGKNAKIILQPFLDSLRMWSENSDNDYCLTNNILTDFFGQQLRRTTLSFCKDLNFKAESLNHLRAALRNASSLLAVAVNGANEPGRRAAKVLQAVSAEFGAAAWLYVDGSTLNTFKIEALMAVARRAKVLISDVQRTEDMVLVQSLFAPRIGSGLLHVALRSDAPSAFEDVWQLGDLSETAQQEILQQSISFQGKEMALRTLEETWPSVREDFGADFLATKREWSIGRPLAECEEGILPRGLSHHHAVSVRALVEKEVDLGGGRLALTGFPEDVLMEAARRLGFFHPDHNAKSRAEIIKDNERWTVLKPEDNPSLQMLEIAKRRAVPVVHWLEYIGGRSIQDICMVWRDSHGKSEALKALILPITATCAMDEPLCCHDSELSFKGLRRALLVGTAGIGKTTALLNFTHRLKKESEDQNQWVVMLKILEHKNLLMKWKDIKDVGVEHARQLVAAAAGAATHGARRFLQSALTASGAVTLCIDGVDEIAPAYMDLMMRLLQRLLQLPLKRIWVATRPEVAVPLRRVLRFPPLKLQPLSQEEQLQFLRNRLTSVPEEKVMQQLKNTGDLLATPLHLMMTAEVFNQSSDILHESSVSLLSIYKKFIELKKHQFEERYVNPDNHSFDDFYGKHEKCAIVFLFADDPLADQLPIQEYKKYIANNDSLLQGKEKFGIVWLDENKVITFIHQTFSEFFAARWLFANAKKLQGARKLVLRLNEPKQRATRIQEFVQGMLAEEWPLHAAAWRREMGELQRLMDSGWGGERRDKMDPMLQGTWWNYLEWANTGNFCAGSLSSTKDFFLRIFKRESWYSWSSSALDAAAKSGCHGVVSELLRHRLFSTAILSDALSEAARGQNEGHMRTMEVLLAHGARDIPVWATTALHRAAKAGNAATLDFFLKRSANVNARDMLQLTPLHLALKGHHHEVVQRLLDEESVNVNARDRKRRTPLYFASAANCVSCAQQLLRRRAQVNGCSVPPLIVAAEKNSVDVLRLLLRNGACINATNRYHETALHVAAKEGCTGAVEVLLEEGADITLKEKYGKTSLDVALCCHHVGIIQVMLKHMISNNFFSNSAMMALVLRGAALIGGGEETLKILQNARFSGEVLRSALRDSVMGQRKEHTEITQILLDNGATDAIDEERRTSLHLAAVGGNAATVALLLARATCYPNARDSRGRTALQVAIGARAAEHQHDAAQVLLQCEDVDVNTEDAPRWRVQSRWASLHYASAADCVSCAEALLQRGAQVHGCSGSSPLVVAAEENNTHMLRFLLRNGADVNRVESHGDTALIAAVKKDQKEAIEVLLQNGADLSRTGRDGSSAWSIALKRHQEEVVQVFLQHMPDDVRMRL